jgi:hypothetical protein
MTRPSAEVSPWIRETESATVTDWLREPSCTPKSNGLRLVDAHRYVVSNSFCKSGTFCCHGVYAGGSNGMT